jgi:carbon-monoxide dehydrogenase medium subunit
VTPVQLTMGVEREAPRLPLSSRHRIGEFVLHRPRTSDEVVALLRRYGDRAVLMAGGVDVLNQLKAGDAIGHVIWLGSVSGLDLIECSAELLRIGPTVTHARFAADNSVLRYLPDVGPIWSRIASPRIRAAGTLAGNILAASSAYDVLPLMLALGARLIFHPDEPRFLVAIEIPTDGPVALRYDRVHKPVVSVAVAVRRGEDLRPVGRVAVGCAYPQAISVPLGPLPQGKDVTEQAAAVAADAVSRLPVPVEDHVASADYRRRVMGVLIKRQLVGLAEWDR